MRRSISAFLAIGLAVLAHGQSFGRFGYQASAPIPDIVLDSVGFHAKQSAADMLRWPAPLTTWKPVETTEYEQTVFVTSAPGGPSKIRYSLLSPGAELYFEKGIKLSVRSTASPLLTWAKGSVTENVPTPAASWFGLSFRDEQPPWLIAFPDDPQSLVTKGAPGQWTIECPDFTGWIHIGLPYGRIGLSTNAASTLGQLAKRCAGVASLFEKHVPKCTGVSVRSDSRGVVAKWEFDRPGALLPPGARFAELGGYPISIRSKTNAFPMDTEEGPIEALTGSELNIFFPVRRVPKGRAITAGKRTSPGITTASPFDAPSVIELALENRTVATRKSSEETLSAFFEQADFGREPWTNQLMPFMPDGTGIDLAAANALLRQALSKATNGPAEANSLLTSVIWRLDWNTWRPSIADSTRARRAAAAASVAAALADEPERRLSAGMLQAGLAAERGIELWRKRYDPNRPTPSFIEPLFGLRQAIFSLGGDPDPDLPFALGLFSPIRCLSDGPIECTKADRYALEWHIDEVKPGTLLFANAMPLEFFGRDNLPTCASTSVFGLSEIRYIPREIGRCIAELVLAPWANDLPTTVPIPAYAERKR